MESAAAIVVEPVTGLEYPFFAMTEVFLAFKRPYLRHANVRYCSLYLIALISALFPVPGYTFKLIPAWFKSERARKTVWELRDQYVCLVNQDTLHGKPPAPMIIPPN